MMLDTEGLNFFLNDRARAQEIVKSVVKAERGKEPEQKKTGRKMTDAAGGETNPAPPADTMPPKSSPEHRRRKRHRWIPRSGCA